jgi:hypothetical protein
MIRPFIILAAITVALFTAYVAFDDHIAKVHTISGPIPAAEYPASRKFALIILVKGDNSFEVDGTPVDLAQLKKLIAEKKWDEHHGLKIKRTPDASIEDTLPVFDLAREMRVSRITVE